MPKLRVYRGRVHLFDKRLETDEVIVGRSAEADVPLDSPAASRRHLRLRRQKWTWYIESLSDKNPALIRQRPFTTQKLEHGDAIVIAEHTLVFEFPPDEQRKERDVEEGRAGANFRLSGADLESAMDSGSHDKARQQQMRRAQADANATQAVSPEDLARLMAQMEKRRGAMLVLVADGERVEFALEARGFPLGWGEAAGIRLPGRRLFGQVAAQLGCLSTGKHTIAPTSRWVKVLVGEVVLSAEQTLRDKDVITLKHAFGFGTIKLRYEAAMTIGVQKASKPVKNDPRSGSQQLGPARKR